MEEKWSKEQTEKSKLVNQSDIINISEIRYIGGCDISFNKINNNNATAYITIYDIITKLIVHEEWKKVVLTIPYISGYLGFREIPVYLELLQQILTNKPAYYPDVLMIDGFGILHPRKFGSASQIGVELNIPSIGIGKTLLNIDGLNETEIKYKFKECTEKGEYIELIGLSGTKYGVAYKSNINCSNPIYITVGHNICLETAIKLVNMCTIYRIPEPIRNSDIKSKLY